MSASRDLKEIDDIDYVKNELTRVTIMLDAMPFNVMVVDRDLNLIYMNKSSSTTLQKLEHLLPIKAANAVGQKIDIFHKNP